MKKQTVQVYLLKAVFSCLVLLASAGTSVYCENPVSMKSAVAVVLSSYFYINNGRIYDGYYLHGRNAD